MIVSRAPSSRAHTSRKFCRRGEPAVVPRDQLRIEGPETVARNVQRHLRRTGQHRLLRCAVATIPSAGLGFRFEMIVQRSEEHTSELQSLMRISYAVFCLKKKNKHITYTQSQTYIYN